MEDSLRPGPTCGETSGYSRDFFAKEWDPEFSKDRKFKKDWSYVEYKRRDLNADGDGISIFLQEFEDSVPSCIVEDISEFCKDVRLDDIQIGATRAGTAIQRRAAWLDDRSLCVEKHGCVREYENPLTAIQLYQMLKALRFGIPDLPDADRRLIYIADLDPYYVLALTETAAFHQVSVLKDAIWQHIALQTSIRVKIPPRQFPIFQFEFQLPYFALRTSSPRTNRSQETVNSKSPRKWTDLSFLKIRTSKPQNERKYGIFDAQISIVICGSDELRWVAYAFADTEFDNENLEDGDFSYEGPHEDPIASNGRLANDPLWNPREYFLTICNVRMVQVLKEWQYLVRILERSITEYVRLCIFFRSDEYSSPLLRHSGTRGDLDWTLQTIKLLSRLQSRLSETIEAWETFKSCDGDIGYFFDCRSPNISPQCVRLSLRAIQDIFGTLKGLQKKLSLLKQSCDESAKALQLRLTLESNEAAQQNGGFAELTASIISPIALAAAYFSIPKGVVPFKLFFVAIVANMVVVRLSFAVLRTLLRLSWWWENIRTWMKTMQVLSTKEYNTSWFALKNGRNNIDKTMAGVEMTMGV
ncbi:hypothetical protein K432DRAFT_307225 [Lepidopterella palustris CBS 459.81]|uniref:Uncharacterized protein n=1 Tax=Lepidopterella palustris CBS 459.81 TaxID=1314670 RepID=A0A8E2JB28_9PEZI|nr:hypothetical protein K432DRAFT_307225 [Lepidopterella palustris CBS 459.81]